MWYLYIMKENNNMPIDETNTTKEQWYDVKKYKDEIRQFVVTKRNDLDQTSMMRNMYEKLYASVYQGTVKSDKERFGHTQEMFKVYKTALIESSLSGYSALLEITGEDGESTLKVPELKKVMTKQFKSMSLIERLTSITLDDWILKGESIAFIKLVRDKELYRIKSELVDEVSGEKVAEFKMKEAVSYDHIEIDRIDPLDFYVDALDYERDPRGCAKIIRSFITDKELLTSDAYPLLSQEDRDAIINSSGRNGMRPTSWSSLWTRQDPPDGSKTNAKNIEVLTFYGDYVTSDNKVLSNIKAVLVANRIADCKYREVNTNCIVYGAYKVDDNTHRGIAPMASVEEVNSLAQKVIDLFIKNMDDVCNPVLMYVKGTLSRQQVENYRRNRQLEISSLEDARPNWWQPPLASQNGLNLIELILQQSKNVLGLNTYMAGDSSGAVRTARESSILFQKANARMRVETDQYNYNFMLRLFAAFYAFNRELALAADMPLNPIYADETLKVSISTNASRADKEGELQRLLQILNLPIAQMIFSNLQPDQVILAVRYLMAKAELSDVDNLLELYDQNGEPTEYYDPNVQQPANTKSAGRPPEQANIAIDNNNII